MKQSLTPVIGQGLWRRAPCWTPGFSSQSGQQLGGRHVCCGWGEAWGHGGRRRPLQLQPGAHAGGHVSHLRPTWAGEIAPFLLFIGEGPSTWSGRRLAAVLASPLCCPTREPSNLIFKMGLALTTRGRGNGHAQWVRLELALKKYRVRCYFRLGPLGVRGRMGAYTVRGGRHYFLLEETKKDFLGEVPKDLQGLSARS